MHSCFWKNLTVAFFSCVCMHTHVSVLLCVCVCACVFTHACGCGCGRTCACHTHIYLSIKYLFIVKPCCLFYFGWFSHTIFLSAECTTPSLLLYLLPVAVDFQIRSVEAVHKLFEKFPEAFMDKLHVKLSKR